jgi:hypothetical protein
MSSIDCIFSQEYFEKASTICAESEVGALGGVDGSIEQLSARITKLNKKFQQESRRSDQSFLHVHNI